VGKWEKVRLGNVCEFINGDRGKNYPSTKDFVDEGIPFVNTGHISNNKIDSSKIDYISKEKFDELRSGKLKENDIIYCLRGSLGKHALVSMNTGAIASSLLILRANPMLITAKYLSYCIDSMPFIKQQIKSNNGSSQPNLSATNVKKFIIPLPPLETQKQIAQTLDTAAELLALRKQQLAELDNLIQATFYEMFGDPIINTKVWKLIKLGDVGELNSGGTPTRSNPKHFLGDIDWYSAGELNERYLCGSKEKLTEEAIINSAAKVFLKGSMLIGMYDTAAFKLGILTKDSSSNQACANINVNKDLVNIEWLYDCAKIMRPFFLNNRRGVRQKNLNLGMIKSFEIPIPPQYLQNQFATLVTAIEAQKALVQQAVEETQYLLDSLMSEYFTE